MRERKEIDTDAAEKRRKIFYYRHTNTQPHSCTLTRRHIALIWCCLQCSTYYFINRSASYWLCLFYMKFDEWNSNIYIKWIFNLFLSLFLFVYSFDVPWRAYLYTHRNVVHWFFISFLIIFWCLRCTLLFFFFFVALALFVFLALALAIRLERDTDVRE